MSSGGEQYFIRRRGRVLGPFDLRQLERLERRGQISQLDDYSTDRRNWSKLDTLEVLFPPPEPAVIEELLIDEPQSFAPTTETPLTAASTEHGQEWHYSHAGQQYGPVSPGELQSLIDQAVLLRNDPVWVEGMTDWAPAHTLFVFPQPGGTISVAPAPVAQPGYEQQQPIQQPIQQPMQQPMQQPVGGYAVPHRGKSKVVAALLAFLIGGLGMHKFYLGNWGWGLIYILTLWTFIPALVSFIEGIMYLAMSDQSFDQKYNLVQVGPFDF